ncbi:MAG: NAD(P)/FAD-dependent oxidoreductase, partial [Proteobacteria bacterium]|nr:NAD(P)/FAD-dependent oxidoreductase [Pseudomonadota bacterium]
ADVCLLEREMDVALGTSCRNSGVLHSGINYKPGTLRAKLAVRGNAMMDELCRDLKVKIKRIGKLTVALDKDDMPGLERIYEQGKANGAPGLEIIGPERMRQIQSDVQGIAALWSPSSSIISPYGLTIALAENAKANGVDIRLDWSVAGVCLLPEGVGFEIRNERGDVLRTKILINAAGLFAANICEMAGIHDYHIYPCRGEYYVLDKRLDGSLRTLIYPTPNPKNPGLGIHLTPTVDGNILIGPSADYQDSPYWTGNVAPTMASLREEGLKLLPDIRVSDYIRNFSGLRAKQTPPEVGGNADFVVEDRADVKGFINVLGIESPGLTSSPAIAEMVVDMVRTHLPLVPDPEFNGVCPGSDILFSERSPEERAEMIAADPDYGEMICRCESVSKREVLDALNNPLGAKTFVSLKYRSRVSMGRCQGGFCIPRIARLLYEEFGWKWEDFVDHSAKSGMFAGTVLDGGER